MSNSTPIDEVASQLINRLQHPDDKNPETSMGDHALHYWTNVIKQCPAWLNDISPDKADLIRELLGIR